MKALSGIPERQMPGAPTRLRRVGRRHPSSGGYARGERTRRRIIESAIAIFAAKGYEATSTRAIARRARVSLPALQYYFGGKAGLHHACVEHIVADMGARLDPAFAALATPNLTRAELFELLRKVIDPFLEALASEKPEPWVLFFDRAQQEGGASSELLGKNIFGRMVGFSSEIVARIMGRSANEPEVLIRALNIVGQGMMIRRARPLLLHMLHLLDLAGERLSRLKSVLWQITEANLAPRREGPDKPQ